MISQILSLLVGADAKIVRPARTSCPEDTPVAQMHVAAWMHACGETTVIWMLSLKLFSWIHTYDSYQ